MKISNNNSRYFSEDLLGVLENFYNVEELRAICLKFIFPFLGTMPPEHKLLKKEMVKIVYELLDNSEAFLNFFQFLPGKLRKILIELAWEGDAEVQELENKMGFPIVRRETLKTNYFRDHEEITRLKEFHFIVLEESGRYDYSPRTSKQVIVGIPPAIRRLICETLPDKPKGYELEFLDDIEFGDARQFCCRESMIQDLHLLSDFVEKGHLKTTKRGDPNKASLRKMAVICDGKEFFSKSDGDPSLEFIRTTLVGNLLRVLSKETRQIFAVGKIEPKHLRLLVDFLDERPHWIFVNLLEHLTHRDYALYVDDDTWLSFQEFIRSLKVDKWISWENIKRYHRYGVCNFNFCESYGVGTRLAAGGVYTSEYYSDFVTLTKENSGDLFDLPLIQGYCFLLAALGFAEIAYTTPPTHQRCPRDKSPYLTPFDGLKAVRLTREGSFAMGFDEDIQFENLPDPRSRISLNPNCLNAICHNIDAVTELSLLEFMEKISPGHYRMTRKTFLDGCHNQSDAKKRFEAFKQNIAETCPPLWQSFFEQTIDTCVALKKKHGYSVFQLTEDIELKNRFATDPLLKSHCLKTEGFKVIIENAKVPVVEKHLKKFGYILQ